MVVCKKSFSIKSVKTAKLESVVVLREYPHSHEADATQGEGLVGGIEDGLKRGGQE